MNFTTNKIVQPIIFDDNKFPVIGNFGIDELADMEFIDSIVRESKFDTYKFGDMPVPRATHIINFNPDNPSIPKYIMNSIYKIGNAVHSMIEHYLFTGEDAEIPNIVDDSIVTFDEKNKINNSYTNMKKCFELMASRGLVIEEVIGIEVPIVNYLYGGTIDAIIKISGKIFIVDFKTSKEISKGYTLQTSAYLWSVNNGYLSTLNHVDGICIIRGDKKVIGDYEYLLVDYNTPYGKEFIDKNIVTFSNILNAYYNHINSDIMFKRLLVNRKGTHIWSLSKEL